MKKNIFLIIFPIFLLLSCSQPSYTKRTDFLPVTLISMTDSVKVGQPVSISLNTEAPNGCWRNLKLYMRQPSDNHILFMAKGDFESTGDCSDNIVHKDSTFNFTLPKAGKYYLQLNESPNTVIIDSLQIVN